MKMFVNFLIVIAVVLNTKASHYDSDTKGVFWHITDIHFDKNYSRQGDPNNMCHLSNHTVEDNGIYGNFLCDSPFKLLDVTLTYMQKLEDKPDFIIWTGDNLPHTRPEAGWEEIFSELNNITIELKTRFPNTTIYPSIGNHDTYPSNLLTPENGSSIYEEFLEKGGWKQIIHSESLGDFRTGGYFTHSPKEGLRIISLNTLLWYSSNTQVTNETNPSQFAFLKDTLEYASCHQEKVYIIGHVPPGFYNIVSKDSPEIPIYHPSYLKEYLKIVKKFSSVIAGQFFGHIHNDYFQIYFCDTGEPLSSSLLAGSVTPWHGHDTLPVNPGIRIVYYKKDDFLLLDYAQYFMNLTEANSLPMNSSKPLYKLLYTFAKTYDVPDLSTKSLFALYERLKVDKELYDKFFNYLTAGKVSASCDDFCKVSQLCAIGATSIDEYHSCMHPVPPERNLSKYLVLLPVGLGLVIAFGIMCFRKNCMKKLNRRQSHYDPFNEL